MSLSTLLSDLVDLEGHKQRAKFKRALREKEIRVLHDLSEWASHTQSKKERLQRKCLSISEQYFELAWQLDTGMHGFNEAVSCLGKWHQKFMLKKETDNIIKKSVEYIHISKSFNIIKNDQTVLFKIAILYHQIAVMRLSVDLNTFRREELKLKDMCPYLSPSIDAIELSKHLLQEEKRFGEHFYIQLVSSIASAPLVVREKVLRAFMSDGLSQFINLVFYCGGDPESVFPDEKCLSHLVSIKQKSFFLHQFYMNIFAALDVYKISQWSRYSEDNYIKKNINMKLVFPKIGRESLVLIKHFLLSNAITIKAENVFHQIMMRFQLAFSTVLNKNLWFDVLYSLQQKPNWENEIRLYLEKSSLQTLLEHYQYLSDTEFNEIMIIFRKRADKCGISKVIYDSACSILQCYQSEIEKRGCISKDFLFQSMQDNHALETKHKDFFSRFDVIYIDKFTCNHDKINALFDELTGE